MSTGVHQYEDKLLDYAYGELPAHEAAAVDAHVRTCAKCGQALAQIKGVRSVFAPLPMVAAPDAGLESLLGYAEQHARRNTEKKPSPWRTWIFGLASAAALIVVGVVASKASTEAPSSAKEVVAQALRDDAVAAPAAPVAQGEARKLDPLGGANEVDAELANKDTLDRDLSGKRGPRVQPQNKVAEDKLAKLEAAPPEPPAERPAVLTPPANRGMDGYKQREYRQPSDAPAQAGQKLEAKEDAPKTAVLGAARASDSKRSGLADNWSNAGAGVQREEALREQQAVDQLNDGTSVKQSINSGSANNRPSFGVSAGPALANADKTPQREETKASPPPPPVAAAPVQPAPEPAPVAKSKSSYGLPRSMPSSLATGAADDEGTSMTESVTRSGDADASRARQVQLAVDAQLAQARAASNSGDRRGEVIAAIAALNAGAVGYSRAEALKRACDGYEALGESDRAQRYCDLLLSEFSGTAAAQRVIDRRKAQLKAPAAKKNERYDFDQAQEKPAKATTGEAF